MKEHFLLQTFNLGSPYWIRDFKFQDFDYKSEFSERLNSLASIFVWIGCRLTYFSIDLPPKANILRRVETFIVVKSKSDLRFSNFWDDCSNMTDQNYKKYLSL